MISDLLQDLRFSLRWMRASPGLTAVAVLTLALGIGATAAIFSLVNGILLSPLPYPEPDRLVRLLQSYPEKGLDAWRLSQANFAVYRDQSKSFSSVAAYSVAGLNLTGVDKPQRLVAAKVTADFFDVLGVEPLLGRSILPEEDTPSSQDGEEEVSISSVCVLSYGLWQRRFGGDSQILGTSVTLNDVPTEVVGVMPRGFGFPLRETDLWVPLGLDPQALFPWFLTGIGRLEPGIEPSAAQTETTGIFWNAAQEIPQLASRNTPPPADAELKTLVSPLKETIVGQTEESLFLLQFAVALILLIACANIANFLLSRSFVRSREIALRYALGASRGRIIKQLLTESVVLALMGAVAGVVIAWWCVRALPWLPVEGTPRIEEVSIDTTVLAVTSVVAVVTGLLFGLVPALRSYRLGLSESLNEGQRGSSGVSRRRMNSALVAAQLALSLVLLIGTGLVLKSFQRLLTVNPGFQPENVLTMVLSLSDQKYTSSTQKAEFYRNLLEQVEASPGVEAAGATSHLPFSGAMFSDGHIVEGHEPPEGGDAPQAHIQAVTSGFFRAMGMPLLRGRNFQITDQPDSQLVAIVDETLARRYWPDGDALGKRIRTTGDAVWLTIVGIVPGIKVGDLTEDMKPHMYLLNGQFYTFSRMNLVIRTASEQNAIANSVQSTIQEIDADVPVYAVRPMEAVIEQTLSSQRLTNLLLTAFAGVALLLGVIGIYGLMSVYVTSRRREMGIRLAFGAQPGNLVRSVLRRGLLLTATGIVGGILAAFAVTRMISSQLYEVSATDPVVFIGAPLLLVAVALTTCYLPARRAALTDPVVALRHE